MNSGRAIAVVLAAALLAGGAAFARAGRTADAATGERMRGPHIKAPFHTGERLFYQIVYLSMSEAATAELKILPRIDFYGHQAWHFQAVAHTQDPLRYVMILDDQFDSYADAQGLFTRQYEMYLNEQGKKSTRKFALNQHTPGAETIAAPAGTRDPLAALFALRENDWKHHPELFFPVFDGRHFYRMHARIQAAHDTVVVPAGKFDATRISVGVSSRAAGVSMNFTIWIANNRERTPVEVDAEVPVGTIRGVLARVQGR